METVLKVYSMLKRQRGQDSFFTHIIPKGNYNILQSFELLGLWIGDTLFHTDCEKDLEALFLIRVKKLLFLFVLGVLVFGVYGVFELFEDDQDWLEVLDFGEHLSVEFDDSGVFLWKLFNFVLDLLDLVLNLTVIRLVGKVCLFLEFELFFDGTEFPESLNVAIDLFPLTDH